MWHAKTTGGYLPISTQEAKDNATEIASYLLLQGYTLEATSAIIGNISAEGAMNPWRWEADEVPTVAEFNSWTQSQASQHGYGLVGFTPASSYINATNEANLSDFGYAPNFADLLGEPEDGAAQTIFFESQIQGNWQTAQWAYNYYYWTFDQILSMTQSEFMSMVTISYNDFKTDDTYTVRQLAGAFELLYEKPAAEWTNPNTGTVTYPAAQSYPVRYSNAEYFYEYFQDNPPPNWNPPASKQTNWKFYLFL